jgi:heat shock protein HslJ
VAEGGALLRRYVGELLRRGFESLLLRSVVASFAALAVAGCGGGGKDSADIEDQPWQLTSATGLTIPEGVVPSAAFTGGSVFGTAGCNKYRAPYTLDGGSLEIGEPAGTLIACPPPVDEFERAYLDALGQVATWELDGEELVLSDDSGDESLRYELASITGNWIVTGINTDDAIVSPIVSVELTALFADDGSLTGFAGCNDYTTSYTADTGNIEIEPPASTKMFCSEPEGLMDQEAAYLAALDAATQYAFNGPTMDLLDGEGKSLVTFTRG